ncbi:MAG: MATE family efflux transporter [Spirochaetaceae bacterium]|nr:MATE family efflux transporter [Spirochaetaceae bacterium]
MASPLHYRKSAATVSLFGPPAFYREALKLAVPVMLQSLITGLVSLVDNFMVAGLGDAKMAGVNVANQINFVFLVIVNVSCMAGGIFLSQYRGASDREGMAQAFRFKIVVASILATGYFLLCQLIPEALLSIMVSGNQQAHMIIGEGARYLKAVSYSFVPIALASAVATSFRDIGEPAIPLLVSTAAALVNTFGNYLLIYGNWGAPRLEVTGAAIATVIARLVETLAFLGMLKIRKTVFSFRVQTFLAIDWKLFLSVLSRSAMMLFSETAWVLSETIITALYNGRGGSETVAGMAAGWSIANLIFLVFPAIHTAANVIVGATLGAGRLDEARQKARWIMSGAFVLGIAGGLAALVSMLAIPLVFANLTLSARMVTRGLIVVIAVYLPLWCLLNAQFAVSRAGGDTVMGVWVDVGVTYLLFIPAAFLIARGTAWGPVALFGVAKLSDIPKAMVADWWLRKEHWVRNLTQSRTS